jgi:hypothetical protein
MTKRSENDNKRNKKCVGLKKAQEGQSIFNFNVYKWGPQGQVCLLLYLQVMFNKYGWNN